MHYRIIYKECKEEEVRIEPGEEIGVRIIILVCLPAYVPACLSYLCVCSVGSPSMHARLVNACSHRH